MPPAISIADAPLQVTVDPVHGGRVAQILLDQMPLLVDRGPGTDDVTAWGSFPMVPWAGRIRRGVFEFEGTEYQLPINFDPHAIHGVGFVDEWTITEHDAGSLTLSLDLPSDDSWPFGGTTEQCFTVGDGRLRMEMSVTAGERAMPVAFGWHPWFRKPDRVEFHPELMYQRDDDSIPTGELVPVPPGPWDDCFINDGPVVVHIGGRSIRLTSDCDHWVYYDMPTHATCIEPQTGPPDAFTLRPDVLAPGTTKRSWYVIEVIG